MAKITEEVGARSRGEKAGIMGALWLLGTAQRLGKATSSAVAFFEEVVSHRSQVRLRGRWLPAEAYDFDRRRK